MVKKYARLLEERDINVKTGEVWSVYDVPSIWRNKVINQITIDGYFVDEDGTVLPIPPNTTDGEYEEEMVD